MYERYFMRLLEGGKDVPYINKGARGLNRKRLTQVPDYHRPNISGNDQVEALRGGTGRKVVSTVQASNIFKKYNIHNLQPGETKQLGTTGINITHCPVSGSYYVDR